MMIFRVGNENNKRILESNDFWVKDVSTAAVLRHERAKVIMHSIKVKSMSKNMKKKGARMMEKTCRIMHLELKINEVTWLMRNSDKKKYISIIM